jgi:diguanylate cyclase (GGDEF)-like protein
MAIVTSDGPGGTMARLLLPAAVLVPVAMGWLPLLGTRSGLYGPEVGVSMFVIGTVLLLGALIWWNATIIYRADLSRRQAEAELAFSAAHDRLTGLANRAMLTDQLTRRLHQLRRTQGRVHGLLFLDLDGFKEINDRLGHGMGDQVLVAVAATLKRCARLSDMVARLGGDEFVLLLDELRSAAEVSVVAERILAAFAEPFVVRGTELTVGVSIGIALLRTDHSNAEAALEDADAALYAAKRLGKGRYQLFEPTHALAG